MAIAVPRTVCKIMVFRAKSGRKQGIFIPLYNIQAVIRFSDMPTYYENWTERTELLLGGDAVAKLRGAGVLVAGCGGVGGYAAEMLCRAGVGRMVLVDADSVAPSNINRQLPATTSTVGMPKVGVMGQRLLDINPNLDLQIHCRFLDSDNIPALLGNGNFDFVIDAIDTIKPKIALICEALRRDTGIVSSMGAGAKTDITKVRVANIWDTFNCGLSRAVRQGLRKNGFPHARLTVVFSEETPDLRAVKTVSGERNKLSTAGTVPYMPAAFGCFLAAHALRRLAMANTTENDKT